MSITFSPTGASLRTIVTAAAVMTLLLVSGSLAAQTGGASSIAVGGQVLDQQSGKPIAGAVVQLLPSHWRAATDTQGRFELRARAGDYIITVSVLGYGEQRRVLSLSEESANIEPLVFRMEPQPVLLEGLRVTVDRFESRRYIVPMSSQVLDRKRLTRSGGHDLADFLRSYGGLTSAPCPGGRQGGCVFRRGQSIAPTVYIDDRKAWGMDELEMYRPADMHHVEVYGRGAMIRAYTVQYVEGVASGKRRLSPFFW